MNFPKNFMNYEKYTVKNYQQMLAKPLVKTSVATSRISSIKIAETEAPTTNQKSLKRSVPYSQI